MTVCHGVEINLVDFLPKVSNQIHVFWPMYLFYFVETTFLLCDIFLAIFLLKLFFTTVVWHKNLTYITAMLVVIQIPAHIGRMVFICYAIVFNFKTHYCDAFLISASCCQMMYAFVMAHASAGFLMERIFALWHLKDYERRRRRYISVCVILFIISAGIYFVYCNTMKRATEYFAYYVVFVVIANIILFFVIILWNKKMIFRVSLSGKPEDYSLNKRFQLVENVRVLSLCKNTAIIASLWLIIDCGIVIYMDFFGWHPMGLMIFELLKSSGPLVVMITVIYSMPKWREIAFKRISRKLKRVYAAETRVDEGDLYFTELAKMWNHVPV